jgi:hypothetical protein
MNSFTPGTSGSTDRLDTERSTTAVTAEPTASIQPARDSTVYTGLTRPDVITRTTAPETTNGTRWEVQLTATPPPAWAEFFKQSAEASSATSPRPHRVTLDRTSIVFKSDEDHVEQWIHAIDTWIEWADARYVMSLDEASRERSRRLDDEAKQRERIQQMNERFKNL